MLSTKFPSHLHNFQLDKNQAICKSSFFFSQKLRKSVSSNRKSVVLASATNGNIGVKNLNIGQISIPYPVVPRESISPLISNMLLPIIISYIISSRYNANSEWYKNLKKPSWNPPPVIFAVVWPFLYATIGVSVWLASFRGVSSDGLLVYGIQLLLNFFWPILFFGWKKLGWSVALNGELFYFINFKSSIFSHFVVFLVFLWIGILSTMKLFRLADPLAAKLLWPYLIWVSFATVLNHQIWVLNKGKANTN